MTRIAPLERPWPAWFDEAMVAVMPKGAEPLLLFRTVATSERAWRKLSAGSLLDRGPLPLRQREIVIDRTTARCGCAYEWGVHAAFFADRAGLSEEQVRATAAGGPDAPLWTDAEATLIATVDALLDRRRLTDDEFEAIRSRFSEEQILEIVQLVAFYHGVSLLVGALALPPEPGTPALPATGA